MTKKLSKSEIAKRRKQMERYLASAKLEGMTLSEKQQAMFDMFDERGWDTEQCIEFVKEMYGYDNKQG